MKPQLLPGFVKTLLKHNKKKLPGYEELFYNNLSHQDSATWLLNNQH